MKIKKISGIRYAFSVSIEKYSDLRDRYNFSLKKIAKKTETKIAGADSR